MREMKKSGKEVTVSEVCIKKCSDLKWHFVFFGLLLGFVLFVNKFTAFPLLSYWYMFIACIIIAAIAMSAGVGGATFFVPFLLLVLNIPVASAIAIGIFVEVFGFAFGVYSYWQHKSINYKLAGRIIMSASFFVILGVILNHIIEPTVVMYIFILALMIFATQILINKEQEGDKPKAFDKLSIFISGLGGFLLGFVSSGMGEANEYNLFIRLKQKPGITAGTSVLVVAVTALIATVTQVAYIMTKGSFGTIKPYIMLIIYSIAGAYFGAQIGANIATKIDRNKFRKIISVLLYLVAISSFIRVYFIGG